MKPIHAIYVFAVVALVIMIKGCCAFGQTYEDICSMFNNGESIYNSVAYIDKNVDFEKELDNEDYWQTPEETIAKKAGDCEDAVLLFAYLNRSRSLPARYCWGDTLNVNSGEINSHAWVELVSTDKQTYVVEFFNPSVNTSFIRVGDDRWNRVRHVVITHNSFCEMAKGGFVRQSYVFDKLNDCTTR